MRVGNYQIELSIAVKITHRYGVGRGSGGVMRRRLETTVSPTQENRNTVTARIYSGIASGVGYHQVQISIAIKVSRGHGNGKFSSGIVYWTLEVSLAVA
jgi:hypothetical protein